MVNRRGKGQRRELQTVKELEKDGWFIVARAKGTKWGKQTDLAGGLFDVLAIKKIGLYQARCWVQVKSNQKPNLKPYKDFLDKYCDAGDSVEVWVWKDRVGFEKIIV